MTSFTKKQYSSQLETKIAVSNSLSKNPQSLTAFDFQDKDLLFSENENSELEIEFDFYIKHFAGNKLFNFKQESRSNSNYFSFNTANQVLPLYDLFCSWRLNLINI